MENAGVLDVAGFVDLVGLADSAWKAILEIVLATPAHTDLSIPKFDVPHPSIVDGFVKHLGDLSGQMRNYRFPLPDGREFHVKEYAENFMAHWDNISAIRNPVGHLLQDAPYWMRAGVLQAASLAVIRNLWHHTKTKRRLKTARKK